MNIKTIILSLLGSLLLYSCQDSKQGSKDSFNSNFKMILRLWPEHHNDTVLRNDLLLALKNYPNTFEEVWFCAEFETLSMDAHRKSAVAMADAAQKMRQIGITPSLQGITIGHGDNFESGSESLIPKSWSTVIDANGEIAQPSHCPRQPNFHKYLSEVYALYSEACQPGYVWLDDDLRITNHWPARQLCFCDTCIHQFNLRVDGQWTRETLVQALEENKDNGLLRQHWIAFSQESLANVARTIAKSVHKVSPYTKMGLQHANFHRELLEGRNWNPIFKSMREETGFLPASRPGNGFYNDHSPREMLTKGYDMARQIRRLDKDIVEITAEVEGYRHYATGKSPHGLCVESLLYLAMGATQLSYAIICSASESMEWYADNYFKNLQKWRPFYQEYVTYNQGTEPGGIDPYISPNQVIRKKKGYEPKFTWSTTSAANSAIGMSLLGMPLCPDGNYAVAITLDAEALSGLSEEEAINHFQHKNILLDANAWELARQLRLDTLVSIVESPDKLSNVTSFESAYGGRIAVVPSFSNDISNTQRLNLLHTADWVAKHQLPIIMESMAQAVVIPRIEKEGLLRSVTLLNCSISEQAATKMRLRGCQTDKKQQFVWKKAGEPDVILHPEFEGSDIIIQIPKLEGWNIGWLAIK